MLIAPPVITSFAILTYLRMWADGWVSLPTILWSVLTGQGSNCPKRTKRTFAGRAATAEEIQENMPVADDSAVLFCQVLLGYGWFYGRGLRALRQRSPTDKIVVVGCWDDSVMPTTATQATAQWLDAPLLWLRRAHCFWVHNPDSSAAVTIQEAVDYISI